MWFEKYRKYRKNLTYCVKLSITFCVHVTQISEEVWIHRDLSCDTQLKEKYSSKQQHEKFVVSLYTHLCPLKPSGYYLYH